MLLEKIRFESGKTLYFQPYVEDLPPKIKNQWLGVELGLVQWRKCLEFF